MFEKLVRSKKDAKDFVCALQKGEVGGFDGYELNFWDPSLFVSNWGGWTRIFYNGDMKVYSHGQGWSDQQASTLCDPVYYVWDNRKAINRALRQSLEDILFVKGLSYEEMIEKCREMIEKDKRVAAENEAFFEAYDDEPCAHSREAPTTPDYL